MINKSAKSQPHETNVQRCYDTTSKRYSLVNRLFLNWPGYYPLRKNICIAFTPHYFRPIWFLFDVLLVMVFFSVSLLT